MRGRETKERSSYIDEGGKKKYEDREEGGKKKWATITEIWKYRNGVYLNVITSFSTVCGSRVYTFRNFAPCICNN